VAGGFCQVLLLQDVLAGSGGVLALLFSYGRSVRREESQRLQWLGEAYRQYMQRTGRLWPRGLAR
jgi:protein-S-isoprenylcysteine O-methyltransferase Ste14